MRSKSRVLSSEVWRKNVFRIKIINHFHRFFGSIDKIKKIKILFTYHLLMNKHFLYPVNKTGPVFFSHHHDRKASDLLRLDQRQCFHYFIQCSESTGHDNKSLRVFHKHDLSHKEIIKRDQFILVDEFISFLFMREINIQADGFSSGPVCPAITRLHDAGTATGDNAVSVLHKFISDLLRHLIIRMRWLHPRRSKDRNTWTD